MPCQIIFTSVLPGMRREQGTAFIFAGPFFDVFFVSSDCALRCTYLYTVYGDTDIGICDKRENTWYAYAHGVSVRSPGGHRHKLGGEERAPHRLVHRFLNLRETDRKRKADFAERVTERTKMKHFSLKALKEEIAALAVIAVFYIVLQGLGISCPIKFVTGISCAGCGMTRAWKALLFHGDFRQAFYYHPLFLLPVGFLVLYLFKNGINPKVYKFFIFTICILFVIVYIYRIFSGSDTVVTVNIREGLLYKLISVFF